MHNFYFDLKGTKSLVLRPGLEAQASASVALGSFSNSESNALFHCVALSLRFHFTYLRFFKENSKYGKNSSMFYLGDS